MSSNSPIVELSPLKFLTGCAVLAAGLFAWGMNHPFPPWVLALEVLVTILALFVFGSIRYRLHKNALTYGAALVIVATFWNGWWESSALRADVREQGPRVFVEFVRENFFTLHGLDQLVHADTMLFILGLTFFVAVIAQTRLLETISSAVLEKANGRLVPTVAALTALVAFSSGILDGVSMIGLMIRTLVIMLFLARVKEDAAIFAVMVSTVVTTVCGMWLAYGEPPNLIMKANLAPYLDNAFFLRYCLPAAVGSYLIVFLNLRRRLKGRTVDLAKLDLLDRHTADIRFLQAITHGEVKLPVEYLEEHRDSVGAHHAAVLERLHEGVPLGEALVNEQVPRDTRLALIGGFVSKELAVTLDDYYVHVYGFNDHMADESAKHLHRALHGVRGQRRLAQRIGALSFVPFVGLLVAHAFDHRIPLFAASFAGFAAAFLGIAVLPKTRTLALRDARNEFKEYLFLLPLFLSITLLQKTGLFEQLAQLLQTGIEAIGATQVAWAQFGFATVLSALLDNNVVADFASRALQGLDVGFLHFFALAQIAGYALGGCWTHIGSAQSVVAYAYIQREINPRYTPFQWIKAMTPVVLQITVFMTALIYIEGLLLR